MHEWEKRARRQKRRDDALYKLAVVMLIGGSIAFSIYNYYRHWQMQEAIIEMDRCK